MLRYFSLKEGHDDKTHCFYPHAERIYYTDDDGFTGDEYLSAIFSGHPLFFSGGYFYECECQLFISRTTFSADIDRRCITAYGAGRGIANL